jgi:hypothetical protein
VYHQHEWSFERQIRKLTGRASPNESIEAADELRDKLVDIIEPSKHLNNICTGVGIFLVEYSA